MIFGTGVDIVDIERIEKLLTSNPRFLERCFTAKERSLFLDKGMKVETIAAGFAAKEAVSKALGTGIRGFNLEDIEVLRDSLGKPIVNLLGQAKDVASSKGVTRFELSLSHGRHQAIAFVIATCDDGKISG